MNIALGVLAFGGGVLATFFASGGYTRERKSILQELEMAAALSGPGQRALLAHIDRRVDAYLRKVQRAPRARFDALPLASLVLGGAGLAAFLTLIDVPIRALPVIVAAVVAATGLSLVAHREIRSHRYIGPPSQRGDEDGNELQGPE